MKVKEFKEILVALDDDDEIVLSQFSSGEGKFVDDPNIKFETKEVDGKIVVSLW